MVARVVLSRSGDAICSSETRAQARHQATVSKSTKCSLPSRIRSLRRPSSVWQNPRKLKSQVTTAIAAVDQEPVQPLKAAKPTADQIFDLHHVTQVSPSLLLYFPFGMPVASAMHMSSSTSSTQSAQVSHIACRGPASKHTYGAVGCAVSCRCALAHRQQHLHSM